ncbi:MAG: efflux RND transporter periplasmic adaptor subunit [Bacteroidetes bacterium]|nr:efflux RND transporter periplasmic adaptor subunit [Bacteroidota bacterium]
MKRLSVLLLSSFLLFACGGSEKGGDLNKLQAELAELKKKKGSLDTEIRTLEAKIAQLDTAGGRLASKLVSIDSVRVGVFEHYIDLQGKVEAEGMAYVAPAGMGGQVKAVYVSLGMPVSKGQAILKLDDAMAQQQLSAARQQSGQLKTRLMQAQTIYERYQNLWKQNIGAEIQVINAKADVDALAAQLRAVEAQVGMAQEQVNMTTVRAAIAGIIDEMNVKVGEFFSPQSAATPGAGIRIVNNSKLKAVTYVPDNYVARVRKGDPVKVWIAEIGKEAFESRIQVMSASINVNTRSFTVEAPLPGNPLLRANQAAVVKILDYKAENAVSVPVNVVQSDEKGKYLFVAESVNGKWVARRRIVQPGQVYEGFQEIVSGLKAGDRIVTDGYQSLYDGQAIRSR